MIVIDSDSKDKDLFVLGDTDSDSDNIFSVLPEFFSREK
jgi:hypothetical protein